MIEVKAAMFAIGSMKALGDDGFPTVFFQNNWNIIGSSVYKLVE